MKKYGATSTAMEDGSKPAWLQIGFNGIGTRQVMDIEVGQIK